MSSSISFTLDSALDDLSRNINTLKNSYQVNDISNQIINLRTDISNLNYKVEEILNIYTTIDELKQRLSIN
jgi:prefoldin subunit 5